MSKTKDPQGRKWNITINNTEASENGNFTHERIKEVLQNLKSVVYWCMADEIGIEEQTPHTHLYIHCSSAIRFSTLKNSLPSAHLERAGGTAQENRDYIAKEGKWASTYKAQSNVSGSFEEWGEMPQERMGGFNVESAIISRILEGASNSEILLEFDYLRGMRDVEYVRQTLKEEEFRSKNRDILVTYVCGVTGVGKSYILMNDKDLGDKYRITDYSHPWDFYAGQPTVIMEEFHSSLKIDEMLNVCDIYPLTLRARYSNKIAIFDKLFIVSNLNLFEQYKIIQIEQPSIFKALLRRIHKVIVYTAYQQFNEYSMADYLSINRKHNNAWVELPPDTPTTFDNDPPLEPTTSKAEQIPLF